MYTSTLCANIQMAGAWRPVSRGDTWSNKVTSCNVESQSAPGLTG